MFDSYGRGYSEAVENSDKKYKPLVDNCIKLVAHLCDGCQNAFVCDSIEVCRLTSNLKKVLEGYLE